MDQALPPRRGKRLAIAAAVLTTLLAGALTLWLAAPRGLQVSMDNARIATITRGMLRDDVAVRATAAPLHSVMLDAVESGRVEEVFVRDGAQVKLDEVLFRLSNPQRRLALLEREAEHAQQISNLTNLRVALEASRRERQRRTSDLAFALQQAQKQHARNLALSRQGFISAATLEESADRLAQQHHSFNTDHASNDVESAIQRDAVRQMEQAISRMEAGLKLVSAAIDALAVRAPVSGRLTDFKLQVGETVTPGKHIGRVDDLAQFKLSALVDEYYLNRIAIGRQGVATISGRTYGLTVGRIYPQIKDGRFTVELGFSLEHPPALSPGQSVEALITLGGASAALLLPNDAFMNDSGGAWAFVLDADGSGARRRPIRTGRRNNSQVEVLGGLAVGDRVIVSTYAGYARAERLQLTK